MTNSDHLATTLQVVYISSMNEGGNLMNENVPTPVSPDTQPSIQPVTSTPQQFGSGPSQPPKRKKLIPLLIVAGIIALIIAGALVVVFVILPANNKTSSEGSAALTALQAKETEVIAAKKDFAKGETGVFNTLEVKANSITNPYTPTDTSVTASSGYKFVLVNISVTNTADIATNVSSFDLPLDADGTSDVAYALDISPVFASGEIAAGATVTGNLVFKVPTTAKTLKLQYTSIVNDSKNLTTENLTYSLEI
jgi:hypothetical protein